MAYDVSFTFDFGYVFTGYWGCTKNEFSIKNFFSKCDQIRSSLLAWSLLMKKSLMENYLGLVSLDMHEQQDSRGRGKLILTALYDFNPFHEHLDISRAIVARSLPLHIVTDETGTSIFSFRAQVANY